MNPAKNSELPEQFRFCGDIWNFYKKYYHIENTDAYWGAMVEESTELHEKYPSRLCKEIILDILDDFDRRLKEEKNAGVFEIF